MLNYLQTLDDNSIDLILLDNIQDKETMIEINRVLKDFIVFFTPIHTVETFLDFPNKLHYCDHISWLRNKHNRRTDDMFVYAKKRKKFYIKKDLFELVKMPSIPYDGVSFYSIDRHLKDLFLRIKEGESTLKKRPRSESTQKEYFNRFNRLFIDGSSRSPRCVNYSNVWAFYPENEIFDCLQRLFLMLNDSSSLSIALMNNYNQELNKINNVKLFTIIR